MQNVLGSTAHSARDAMMQMAQYKNLKAQNENLAKQNDKIAAETKESSARTKAALAEAAYKVNSAKVLGYQMPGLQVESDIDESAMGKFLRWLNRSLSALTPFRLGSGGVKTSVGKFHE